jgi:hypothetical protein
MLPDTQLYEPGVPRVLDVVAEVAVVTAVGVEPDVEVLPHAEITMVIDSATSNRSAKRDFFVIIPPT